MLIIGLDLETTGVDTTQDEITEIGAVLWDTVHHVPLRIVSDLVKTDREIPPEVTDVTGITRQMLDEHGITPDQATAHMVQLLEFTPVLMAHFGTDFDRPMFQRFMGDHPLTAALTWIDSSIDIVFSCDTRRLSYLAAEHGFLNPFAHRAVFDVLTMLRVSSFHDFDAILARAKEPTVYARAIVPFDKKDLAKDRGYRWAPKSHVWWKTFKTSDYLVEIETCGFPTAMMQEKPRD